MINNKPTDQDLLTQIAELKKQNKTLLSKIDNQGGETGGLELVKANAYQHVVETVSDLITIVDNQGIILFVNHASETIYGLTPDECIGVPAFDFIHPEDQEFTMSQFGEWVKSKNNYFSFENRQVSRQGKVVNVLWNIHIERHNGEVVKITSIARDITEQKLAEQKLDTAETKYKTLFEQASEGILIINEQGNYIDVNQRGCDLLKYSKEELLKLHINDIIEKEDLNKVAARYDKLKKSKSSITERLFIRKDGSKFPVEISTKILSDGTIQGFVRDISIQKQYENDIIVAKEKAQESDRLKSAFLANISHEIRTPMNAILGFTNLLKNQNLSNEKKEKYRALIDSSGKKLIDLVSDIVDISKIEENQLSINRTTINLNELVKNLQTTFSVQPPNADVLLIKESFLDDHNCFIIADEVRLKQALSNLIENSQKFTSKGQINFGYTVEGESLHFFVKDTGIGIDPVNHKHIFDRFRQIDNDSSQEGSGLGLSITKGLVELLDGKIWVESELNKGAKFSFSIPHVPSTPMVAPILSDEKPNSTIENRPTVLIAEDNMINFMYLEAFLKSKNYNVIHVTDGQEAVNKVEENPAMVLVFMDINMPNMDGLEATKKIRKFNATIPIIGQSGHSMEEDVQKALDAGLNAYLPKPFTDVDLNNILLKYIKVENNKT